jgi:ankyrin repeat protein
LLRNLDVEMNVTDKLMSTALRNAAGGRHLSIVNLLLCADAAKVDVRDKFNRIPLWLASSKGHRDVVLRLLLEDVDVNVVDWVGSTPLHNAAKDKDLPFTELLLERQSFVLTKSTNAAVLSSGWQQRQVMWR